MDFPDPWEKADLLGYPTKRAIAEEERQYSKLNCPWYRSGNKAPKYFEEKHCEACQECFNLHGKCEPSIKKPCPETAQKEPSKREA